MQTPSEPNEITREGLRVAIGLPSAVLLVMGGMVGVGIFVNPAVVAKSLPSPGLALLAWSVGGVMAILGAFVYAELAARIPATGGEYVYLRETYGPLTGFLFGWTTLLVVQAGGWRRSPSSSPATSTCWPAAACPNPSSWSRCWPSWRRSTASASRPGTGRRARSAR